MANNKVIRKHGKIFYLSSKFLDKNLLSSIYSIYEMCREIDDIVDNNELSFARQELENIKKNLSAQELKKRFNCLQLIDEKRFPNIEYLNEFILGQESDTNFHQPKTIIELLKYCYRVAGVIGLMICDAVGIKDENLKYFAIDLGIAMQLVNIVRDIKEDAKNNRIYMPVALIGKVTPHDVLNEVSVINKINIEKKKILAIADKYFDSANQAIEFLSANVSTCFIIASKLYQFIGIKILKKEKSYLDGRTYLNRFEKLFITAKYYFKGKRKQNSYCPLHNNILHLPIKNLPSVDA
jgi:phytoene synthase